MKLNDGQQSSIKKFILKQLCTSLVCIKEVFCTYFSTFSFYISWKTGKMKSKIGAESKAKQVEKKANFIKD